MQRNLSILLLTLFLNGAVQAQFRSQASGPAIPVNSQGLSSSQNLPVFAPDRFNMHHSFSLGMSYAGGQSFSLGTYTNQMNFKLRDNLLIQTQVSLVQPSGGINPYSNQGLNNQIYYGASLDYQPLENFHISFSLNNYPRYSLYRPYSSFSLIR
ncbi:MAG: hypothetical protein V3S22_04655 [Candidatus Neomarinimicrobiota bacterium]